MSFITSLAAVSILVLHVDNVAAQSTKAPESTPEPPVLATGPTVAPDVAVEIVFARFAADRARAERTLAQIGRPPVGMTAAQFEQDRRRAEALLPLVVRVLDAEQAYRAGQPLPLFSGLEPAAEQGVILLNLIQAHGRGDRVAAKMWADKLPTTDGLFRMRTGATADDQRLLRLTQFLRAELAYHDGDDVRAVASLARLVPGGPGGSSTATTLKPLEKAPAVVRLAVLPFSPVGADETLSLLEEALVEVMSADLAAASTLEIVSRALVRTRQETIAPALETFVAGGHFAPLRELVPATHLLSGATRRTPSGVHVTLRLIDVSRGLIIASVECDTREDAIFDDADRLLIDLFARTPLASALEPELLRVQASPEPADARALVEARRLQNTDEPRARARFLSAMRGSPATAFLFSDLVKRFPDVRPTIAVLPFSSERGEGVEPWHLAGLRAGVAHDLLALGFSTTPMDDIDRDVVERAALPAAGSIADAHARTIAQARAADLALVGSVLVDGSLHRLIVRVIHVRSGRLLFTTVVDERNGDLPVLLLTFAIALATHFHVIEPDQRKDLLVGDLLIGRVHTRATFETWARGTAHPTPPAVRSLASAVVRRTLKPGRPITVPFTLGVIAVLVGAPAAAASAYAAQPFAMHAWQLHGLQQAVVDPAQREALRAERDQNALIANLMFGGAGLGLALVGVGVATVVVDGWLASRTSVEEERLIDGKDPAEEFR
jgi:TolB-like protein